MAKSKSANDNFIKQGSILAVASVISRIIGLLYRSPMTAIIGDEGNGLYSYAFEVYSIALILSSYSMPLAVSKILSGKIARKEYRNAYKIFRYAMIFAAISGFAMMAIIFFAAPFIEKISNYQGLTLPLRVLSPTIFVVAIVGTIRGFFQSRKTMIPTAVSQLADQIINALVSVLAAYLFVLTAKNSLDHASKGAAGGTLGTLFGALSSLFFLIFLFVIYRPRMKKHLAHDRSYREDTSADIWKMLFATIIPVILSQSVYQASGLIDGTLFGNLYGGENNSSLWGSYSTKYRVLVNVPNAIASSMASSMIPTLVSLYSVGNMKAFKNKLAISVKVNMMIAIPCAVGLAVLGTPIMRLLFPTTDFTLSGKMLTFGSIAVVFYALSTITNAALQGLDKMRKPVINAAISLAIHVVLTVILLKFTGLGVYTLIIGNITFPLVVCILNWIDVNRYAGYHQEIIKTFLIPSGASLIMGAFAFGIYKLIVLIGGASYIVNFIGVMISMILAVIIYFAVMFLTKGLTHKDLLDFPMGLRIERLAVKLKLMR